MVRGCRLIPTIGVFILLIVSIFAPGCDDPSVFEPADPKLPPSNQRIVSQAVFGNPNFTNYIDKLYDYGSSNFYFRGRIDDNYVAGKINRSGQILWTTQFSYYCRSLCVVPENSIGLSNAAIYAGWEDRNGDDRADACIDLVGVHGQMIDSLMIARKNISIWFNSISAIDSLNFIGVGGATVGVLYYPFLATFRIAADSSFVLKSTHILETIPNTYFTCVKSDPDEAAGNQFVCYVVAEEEAGGSVVAVDVLSLRGSSADLATIETTWTVRIPHELPMWASLDCLVLQDGFLYVQGAADVEKANTPSNGGYWDAGFVASISTSGALNWLTMIELSGHSEGFSGMHAVDGILYVVGEYDSYINTDTGRRFGYALISILDAHTGVEKYHLAFGSPDNSSYFGSIFVDGARAFCAGWTERVYLDGGYRAWFAEVKIDNLSGSAAAELRTINPTSSMGKEGSSDESGVYHLHDSVPPPGMLR